MSINAAADRVASPLNGSGPGEKPTGVRYIVIAFTVMMSILLYLDRFAISVAMKTIGVELELDEAQLGLLVTYFFYSYGLAQVPMGWLGDRWGGRIALTLFVLTWSLAIALFGFAHSLWMMVALRVMLGLGQAGAYATTASFLKRWIPLSSRGFANGAVTMGGRSGGLLANVLTPHLMALVGVLFGYATGQWRLVFLFYGLLGIAWSVGFWFFFRDTPAQHPRCNDAERELIAHGIPVAGAVNAPMQRLSIASVLTKPNLWIMCVLSFSINVGWIFLAAWMPTYLQNVHKLTVQQSGNWAATVGLGGVIGCFCGGLATDFFVRRFGLLLGRRIPGVLASAGAATCYVICAGSDDLYLILALFATIHFLADFALGSVWSSHQDIGGSYVGTVLGFTNMCGNLGAGFFGGVIGKYAKAGDWTTVFWMSCGGYIVALICWLLFDPRKPVAPNTTP